ncbi:uncharacterized protein PHACADRAFT_87635 [Phanerochaete carnosa HHB-10118-sp]|uniref:Fe2OG dioxygenase domain-containing protein n=1 Tax=Phanerochaete carnosa (strain HHB-10118-sp) TaxID=650164 RepID=K5XAH0_PHACS|nr:uncharacterized protein PHACADRAFT_87635 [Phanerochaete carnosa HHB-10118-sp]EKM59912.1 hypothetical protein PHACADRAFT_87635 [Phanerochaete carnosa HHB-10118-sp]
MKLALRMCPSIPGLYFDPSVLLPDDLAETLFQQCLETYFRDSRVNQAMLFERVVSEGAHAPDTPAPGPSGLPPFLTSLLATLADVLRPALPPHTHALLFPPPDAPPQARQVIVNLYRPGEGIAPHVDLLDRFGDGIVGVCLGSGCVMRFRRARPELGHASTQCPSAPCPRAGSKLAAGDPGDPGHTDEDEGHAVFLPHGGVYVMSEEARYRWTHGIEGRTEDWVQDRAGSDAGRWVMRFLRVSITFRWLLPGADVVGGLPDAVSSY